MYNQFPAYGYPFQTPGIQQSSFMTQSMQQQVPQQGGPDWIMVSTVKQAEQVSVQPGQKAWVMVQNAPIFALRTADNMGLITTDYYKFEKINPDIDQATAPNYVTPEQLEARLTAFADSLKPGKETEK